MTADRRILPGAQAQLIDKTGRATPPFYDFLRRLISATEVIPEGISDASFLTVTNETATLPNSRRLVSSDNIDISTTVAGQLRISAQVDSGIIDSGYPPQLGHAGI